MQDFNTDFTPKPPGALMGKAPLPILKELEHQARQNISTLNFTAAFAKTSSSCNATLGRSLRSKFYKGPVVRPGKKATHKRSSVEGSLPGPSKLQGPVPEPNSASCNGQLNSGSLHKQTRGNSLSRDVHSPVENHDMVPSLSHNIKSQTHSRVSECDGQPSAQVEPSAVNRLVTATAGIQTDLSKVVHSSCKSICHSSEPQTSTVRISSPRHRCSELKLDGFHCLCLPSDGSPSQGDQKNQPMALPDHHNGPRLARDDLVLGPSVALGRDPTATSGVQQLFSNSPTIMCFTASTTSQPPHLVSRCGQLQEQGFSVEVAERIAAPQVIIAGGLGLRH